MAENVTALRTLARLRSENELMYSLRRDGAIDVEGEGEQPYRSYKVTVYAETYVKPGEDDSPLLSKGPHIFRIEAKSNYPLKDAPIVNFISTPPAHVNVYAKGQVCIGRWNPRETLASETVRTLRVLFLDPATFNFDSAADHSCKDFCRGYSGGVPKDFPLPCPVFNDEMNEGQNA